MIAKDKVYSLATGGHKYPEREGIKDPKRRRESVIHNPGHQRLHAPRCLPIQRFSPVQQRKFGIYILVAMC